MSFGSPDVQPKADLKPLGADAYRASTNEQARPVPYLAGKRRLAITWITDHFDDRADAVTQTIGKQSTKSGYNYFSSAAGLACSGPVDALFNIYLNGESVYASTVRITILSITRVGAVATATTQANHGLTTGDEVEHDGADQPEYNGTHTVTVTGLNTYTFAVAGTPATPATGNLGARLILDPVFRDGDNPDYVDIVIPDYGTMRLYWGTETQTPDITLNRSGTTHPSYRGNCYVVFDQVFLGFNQTNFPNVELVLARWPKPRSGWHSLAAIEDDANPIAAICDLLQHPRASFRVPDALLDTVTLYATAARLAAEGLGISPLITRQSEMREVLTRALEYIDGYFTTDSQGRLGVKLCRVPEGALPEIADANITAPVEFTPEDWMVVKTGVNVKFTNRDAGHLPDSRQWRDAGALRIRGERDDESVDRDWITRPDLAANLARSLGRMRALPKISGRAKLRLSGTLFADLAPGALFTFNLSTRSTVNLVFRVEDRALPDSAKPEFEISFRVDRSYLYPPAPTTLEPPQLINGLLAWFKADALTGAHGSAVNTWLDSSGNSNHAARVLGGKAWPKLNKTSEAFPYVEFDEADTDYLQCASALRVSDAQPQTLICVWSAGNDDEVRQIAGHPGPGGGRTFELLVNGAVNPELTAGNVNTVQSGEPFTTNWLWARCTYDGIGGAGTQTFSLLDSQGANGALQQSVCGDPNPFTIGFDDGGAIVTAPFHGGIAEVMLYDHALNEVEWAAVLAYLQEKYSL